MSDFAKGISDLAGVIDRILGIDKVEQQAANIVREKASRCESCGAPGTHLRTGYDVAPTDRGDERRYKEEWYCDECEPQVSHER